MKTIKIEVNAGVVTDVTNLPEGYETMLPPGEGIPAGYAGPWASRTGPRTRQTRRGNEDQ